MAVSPLVRFDLPRPVAFTASRYKIVVTIRIALALAVLTGCGRIGFGHDAPSVPQWVEHVEGAADSVSLPEIATAMPIGGDSTDLFLAVISVKPSYGIASVSGLGLSWQKIHEQCAGRDTARLAMFWAQGPAAMTGPVAAKLDVSGSVVGSAVISVHRYRGVAATSPIGNTSWANTNGNDGMLPCSGGSDTASYSWSTLRTQAPASIVFVGVHTARYPHAPGAGFTERAELQSGDLPDSAGIAVEDIDVATPAVVPIAGAFPDNPDWAAIAVEIRS